MEENYTLRRATLEDAYEIWTVMDTCSQTLLQKDHFICDDYDYVKELLSGGGFAIVACDSNHKIVGNLLVKYPGLTEENLGYDVFVPNPEFHTSKAQSSTLHYSDSIQPFYKDCCIPLSDETLFQVVHMDSASVLPHHRGHGLEGKMISLAESLIDTSLYSYAFATVAPQNHASLKTLEKQGYKIMVTKEKYGELLRHVMMKELGKI